MKYKVRRGFLKKKKKKGGFLKTCVQGGDGSGAEDSKHLGSQSACYGHNSKHTRLLFGSRISTLPKAFLVKHCVCVCVCVWCTRVCVQIIFLTLNHQRVKRKGWEWGRETAVSNFLHNPLMRLEPS